MNYERELKLQAWLDGELPPDESRQVDAWLRTDPQLHSLAHELKLTRLVLAGNELERTLPESREFFWSKILRQIEREDSVTTRRSAPVWRGWWIKFLAPAAIAASLLLIVGPNLWSRHSGLSDGRAEFENPLEDMSVFTFRSESEGMTVVWVSSE